MNFASAFQQMSDAFKMFNQAILQVSISIAQVIIKQVLSNNKYLHYARHSKKKRVNKKYIDKMRRGVLELQY